jgi:pyruvate, water dikinase
VCDERFNKFGLFFGVLLILLSACGTLSPNDDTGEENTGKGDDSDSAAAAGLSVQVLFENSRPVSGYSVTAVLDNGTSLRAYCASEKSEVEDGISCRDFGVEITGDFNELSLTVKAHGYAFSTQLIKIDELEKTGNRRSRTVRLSALEAFETTEDYRTGFSKDELEAFKQSASESSSDMGPVYAVKFVIANFDSTPEVYFQNTVLNPVHYDFVRSVLGINISSAEFWAQAYSGKDRRFMAGTVMLYDSVNAPCDRLGRPIVQPVVLTFFPSDDLTVSQARRVYRLIEERLGFAALYGETNRFFYLPAGENQEASLAKDKALLESWDAKWVLRTELYKQVSLQVMNTGTAYGTLRFADESALETAVFSFRDIALLPALPTALPIVGGTVTEEFQTPLSHVNIMAKNRGTPNITLREASSNPEISALFEKLVRFEVTEKGYTLREASLKEAEAFWESARKEPVILKSDSSYDELPLFADIGFEDSIRVGAKAANSAQLHQLLGEGAPCGFAVPFFYYRQFMDNTHVDSTACKSARTDCVSEGREEALCDAAEALCLSSVAQRLTDYVDALLDNDAFATGSELREAALAGLRFLIVHGETDEAFAKALDARVAEIFGSQKVRLRSSTNAEDIPGFSGAGLYDSVGAYASGDNRASQEIRKVWASVWNWRAFEERSFWNMDHRFVRMGTAVNRAFEDEAANGVLITQNIADKTAPGMYVNVQLGEFSVTNPNGYIVPEIFSIISGTTSGSFQAARLCYSSISPNEPIMRDEEITKLYGEAMKVQLHFADLYEKSSDRLALDLEFKLLGNDRSLIIKQARPYMD